MRWSERPPVVRSRLPSLQPVRFGPRTLSVAVAHLVLVSRMATSVVPVALLFFVRLVFASMPLIAAFRDLPRWIRFALHSSGAAFLLAAGLLITRSLLGPTMSPVLYRLIFTHVLILSGAGLGILFLLAASGEYFKALRKLDEKRRKPSTIADERPSDEYA